MYIQDCLNHDPWWGCHQGKCYKFYKEKYRKDFLKRSLRNHFSKEADILLNRRQVV